ncbi:MAG TPA: sigma factor, partial [Verrucomicrobiae bacterium]
MAEKSLVDAQAETKNNLETRTDLELIAAINGGDTSAFEVLYLRYRDWVTGLAHRFTEDNDLALDVLQETFLYFLKKFPGFVLTAQLKTFLYPVVKNLSI